MESRITPLLSFLFLLFLVSSVGAQHTYQTVTVGSGTSTSVNLPFTGARDFSWSTSIYPQQRVNQSGVITAISYEIGASANNQYTLFNQDIYLSTYSDSIFPLNHSIDTASMTKVFSGGLDLAGVSGWVEIPLEQPFYLGSNENLLVAWINLDGTADAMEPRFKISQGNGYTSFFQLSDGRINWNINPFRTNAYPNIKLKFISPYLNDVSAEAFQSDLTTGLNDLVVRLRNTGTQNLTSATVNWSVNGVTQVPYNWTGSLNSGMAADSVTIGSFNFGTGSYDIVVWTTSPNGLTDSLNENDTLHVFQQFCAPLSGIYTIGASAADFPNFTQAVQALVNCGVQGPVTFQVQNGTYTEQLVISEISGASSTNTITFESQAQDSTAVELFFNPGLNDDRFTVRLDHADYITFRKLTLACGDSATSSLPTTAFEFIHGSDYNEVSNCIVRTVPVSNSFNPQFAGINSPTLSDTTDNFNSFHHNAIYSGMFGIGISGFINDFEIGNEVYENLFYNQLERSIQLVYQVNAQVSSNIIQNDFGQNGDGIAIIGGNQGFDLTTNKIYLYSNNEDVRGVFLSDVQATSTDPALVTNNFIFLDLQGTTSFSSEGLYVTLNEPHHYFYNNTITVSGTRSNSYSFYSNMNVSTMEVKNNLFTNFTGGNAAILRNNNISDYNHFYSSSGASINGTGNTNQERLDSWTTSTGNDVHSFALDPEFFNLDDFHIKLPETNNLGTPISWVTTDLDGEARHATNPDIGADEFNGRDHDAGMAIMFPGGLQYAPDTFEISGKLTSFGYQPLTNSQVFWALNDSVIDSTNWTGNLNFRDTSFTFHIDSFVFDFGYYHLKSWTKNPNGQVDSLSRNDTTYRDLYFCNPMKGIYTIGSGVSDFATINEAVGFLKNCGVDSHTVFQIHPGIYDEFVTIPYIQGVHDTAQISFTTFTGSQDVILTNSNHSQTDPILYLDSTDYLSFSKLRFELQDANVNGIMITNLCDYIEVSECRFTGPVRRFIYSIGKYSGNSSYLTISDNVFTGGESAVNIGAVNASVEYNKCFGQINPIRLGSVNGSIIGNEVYNFTGTGIFAGSNNGLLIRANILTVDSTKADIGIVCSDCDQQLTIERNKVSIHGRGGMSITGSSSSSSQRAKIQNNFIHVVADSNAAFNSPSFGMYSDNCSYHDVFHNSVNITGHPNLFDTRALETGVNNGRFYNNNLVNQAGGIVHINRPFAASYELRYNNYYTTGPVLMRSSSGSVYTNLQNWQAVVISDSNSISTYPYYFSDRDLHTRHYELNEAGTTSAGVTNDIDLQSRFGIPDIGADEFTVTPIDAGILSIDSPLTPIAVDSHAVWVSIKNFGYDTLFSSTIFAQLDGGAIISSSWSDTLLATDTLDSLYVGKLYFDDNFHNLKVWTAAPNGTLDFNPHNDTLEMEIVTCDPLVGTYTIGDSTRDFQSFKQAVKRLHSCGVGGPVVFKVDTGTYDEQVIVPEILYTSSSNTVTFESVTGNPDDVRLIYGSSYPAETKGHVLQLHDASFVRFRNMTIRADFINPSSFIPTVVLFSSGSHHNKFENCIIDKLDVNDGPLVRYFMETTDSTDCSYNSFVGNTFLNGEEAVAWSGGSAYAAKGMVFEDNIFRDQYRYGLEIRYVSGLRISGNRFESNVNRPTEASIFVSGCLDSLTITGNRILRLSGYTEAFGIELTGTSLLAPNRALVANNIIHFADAGDDAIGIYIRSGSVDVFHNTVKFEGSSPENWAASFTSSQSTPDLRVYNNIFSNEAGGYAVNFRQTNASIFSDYNILNTSGPFLVDLAFQDYTDLLSYSTASGMDTSSYEVQPAFSSPIDLHLSAILPDSMGTYLVEVQTDIDGEQRSIFPDIGADERPSLPVDAALSQLISPYNSHPVGWADFTVGLKNAGTDTLFNVAIHYVVDSAVSSVYNWSGQLLPGFTDSIKLDSFQLTYGNHLLRAWTADPNGQSDGNPFNDTLTDTIRICNSFTGTYTIGTGKDYPTFTAAVEAVAYCGVSGPVVFEVDSGLYIEEFDLPYFNGVSAVNTVTFRSADLDSSAVMIKGLSNQEDFTVNLIDAHYIIFDHIGFTTDNNVREGLVRLWGNSDHNAFRNCLFSGRFTSSSSEEMVSMWGHNIYNAQAYPDSNVFEHNRFFQGYTGLEIQGSFETRGKGNVVVHNEFRDQYRYGFRAQYQDGLQLNYNIVKSRADYSNYTGFSLYYLGDEFEVLGNQVVKWQGRSFLGMQFYRCESSTPAIVANNFVSIAQTSTSSQYGIQVNECANLNIYYNTLVVRNDGGSGGYPLYLTSGNTGITIRNNIMANFANGRAFYGYNTSMYNSNYNDLYTNGSLIAQQSSGSFSNLSGWATATNMDTNSVDFAPQFKNDSNLHINTGVLYELATPLAEVTIDIDGQPRDTLKPDLGADEEPPLQWDVDLISINEPAVQAVPGSHDLIITILNLGYDTLTKLDIIWQIDSGLPTTYNWTGSLNFNQTDTVNLGPYVFPYGTHQILARVTNPNDTIDENPGNDTNIVSVDFCNRFIGTYTIGPSGRDFSNFNDAVDQLYYCGVSGPVEFLVDAGTYSEQVTIPKIDGASDTSHIVFRGATNDSTQVTLTYLAVLPGTRFTLKLDSCEYIEFAYMTITSDGTPFNFDLINIWNAASHNTFRSNRILGPAGSYLNTNNPLVRNEIGANDFDNTFRNNFFQYGVYGLKFEGALINHNETKSSLHLVGNTFENQYKAGIDLFSLKSLVVDSNVFVSQNDSGEYKAMHLTTIRSDVRISRNYIDYKGNGYGLGMDLNSVSGSAATPAMIYNNSIHLNGYFSFTRGIECSGGSNVNLYHNSVHLTGNSPQSEAVLINGSSVSNVNLKNNVLSNEAGGVAMRAILTTNVDYNNYYATGPNLVDLPIGLYDTVQTWGGSQMNDLHSVTVYPKFLSDTDLHVGSFNFNDRGTPVGILVDYDSIVRNPLKPDIGAFEFDSLGIFLGNDTGICTGDSFLLKAQYYKGFQYVWQELSGFDTLSSDSVLWVDSAGTYTVFAFDTTGLELADTIVVHINQLPVVDLGNDTAVCDNVPMIINAFQPGATYLWSNNSTDSIYNVSMTDTVSLVLTDSNNCQSAPDSIFVLVNPAPQISLGPDTAICTGESIAISPGTGYSSYLWSDNSSASELIVSSGGNYHVQVTDSNGCVSSNDTFLLTLHALPVVNLGNDTGICAGDTFEISVPGYFVNYSWSDPFYTDSIFKSGTADTVALIVTDTNNCVSVADTVLVGVNQLPVVDLGNDTVFCSDDSVRLAAGPGYLQYLWSVPNTDSILWARLPGTVSVVVQDQNLCYSEADSVVISNYPLPTISLRNDTTICPYDSVLLDGGSGFVNYNWNTSQPTQQIYAQTSGQYKVIVTDLNGCMNSDSMTIGQHTLPLPDLGNDTAICTGDSIQLNPGIFASYVWSNAAISNQIWAVSGGNYWVEVQSAAGCKNSDTLQLALNPLPVVNLGNDTAICDGTSITLDAGNFISYSWLHGPVSRTALVNQSGIYSVTVTDVNSCQGQDDIQVTVNPLPKVNLGNDTSINNKSAITLDAGGGFANYDWSTGASTQTLLVDGAIVGPGVFNYSVTVTDGNDCQGTDQIRITVIDITGVEQLNGSGGLKVFPNPAHDYLSIQFDQVPEAEVQVIMYSNIGQRLLEKSFERITDGLVQLDVSEFSAGTYQAIVRSGKNQWRISWVKQ